MGSCLWCLESLKDCPGIEAKLEMQLKWPSGNKHAGEALVLPFQSSLPLLSSQETVHLTNRVLLYSMQSLTVLVLDIKLNNLHGTVMLQHKESGSSCIARHWDMFGGVCMGNSLQCISAYTHLAFFKFLPVNPSSCS